MPLCPVVAPTSSMSVLEKRDVILKLEDAIKSLPNCKDDGTDMTDHDFLEGVYLRTCTIPQGMVVTGKIHKYPCLNVITMGRCLVFSEEMDAPKEYKAGDVFPSGAGIKKAVYAIEETKFMNTFSMEEVAVEEIDDLLTLPSYDLIEEMS